MNLGTAQVIRANARHLPLADNSVDLVVTSPPYFALRSYQDGGAHYAGQIGDEPTPAEFVASLLEVTRECVRVLKPSGSLWVNLGDKYAGSRMDGSNDNGSSGTLYDGSGPRPVVVTSGQAGSGIRASAGNVRQKSLIGIPWRYALACIDDLGLILRAEVIWSKPNGLPESVTDRVRRSHEQWFHFVLQPRYFSAVDEIREHYAPGDQSRSTLSDRRAAKVAPMSGGINPHTSGNPLGKLPGSVWTVPTEPLRVPDHLGIDHFAAFPTEWPRRIIQGWSPAGVCVECGEGRRPVTRHLGYTVEGGVNNGTDPGTTKHGTGGATLGMVGRREVTGYACACTNADGTGMACGGQNGMRSGVPSIPHVTITGYACACPEPTAPTTPAVVLDPFGGTGTTALVAKALGRHGISVDMSADYCRLAEWRTNDRDQLAKVLGIAKVGPADDAQLDLFGEAAS